MLLFAPSAPGAQVTTASPPVVTAAYLLNFVKFVTWPPDALAATAPVMLCVADRLVADAVAVSLANWPAGARPVTLARVSGAVVPGECSALYVADLDARGVASVLAAVGGRSVLPVSSTERFAARGGIIELFIDGGTMKFAVNPQAAERARLRIDARLLTLARIVGE